MSKKNVVHPFTPLPANTMGSSALQRDTSLKTEIGHAFMVLLCILLPIYFNLIPNAVSLHTMTLVFLLCIGIIIRLGTLRLQQVDPNIAFHDSLTFNISSEFPTYKVGRLLYPYSHSETDELIFDVSLHSLVFINNSVGVNSVC